MANVEGREVTLRELNAELGGAAFPDPKARKVAEQNALRNIVGRIVLSKAAEQQGLDKTPEFAVQKQRALDSVLAQALQQKLVASVPQATAEEARSYMNAHNDTFVERKIFIVDQVRMPRVDAEMLKVLEPLKTLEQIEEVLKAHSIPYQRTGASLDAVGADPRLVAFILKLPPNEVFVLPANEGLLVNRVKEIKVVPFTGDQALEFAKKWVTRERTQESVQRSFSQLLSQAAPKVKFNKDYAPPKASPAAPGAPAAGVGAAPGAAPAKP